MIKVEMEQVMWRLVVCVPRQRMIIDSLVLCLFPVVLFLGREGVELINPIF